MKTIAYTGLGSTGAMVYLLCHDNYHFIEPEAYLADNLTHHQFYLDQYIGLFLYWSTIQKEANVLVYSFINMFKALSKTAEVNVKQ